jgi:cob(I)alamin adenosyltransferase
MSIVTKRGDRGQTTLMYNRPVSKCHARVEACGAVDELNAAIGLARAVARRSSVRRRLDALQQDLVRLMGELATTVKDLPRYVEEGHSLVSPAMTAALERWIGEIEVSGVARKGWAIPGANMLAAVLDLARTVCRRAERRACALQEAGQLKNPEVVVYLNRLSDLLWLLARRAEARRP